MAVRVKALPPYRILYKLPNGTYIVVIIGGRGGSKTYEASKWTAYSATIEAKRCAIVRDEKSLIKDSILNEVLSRYDTANHNGQIGRMFQRLETGIKDKKTGDMVVFTKGFRASDTKKKANLKGIANVDIAVIEEAEDIRDVDKFNTFSDSIRKPGAIIVIILNTPDIGHWIVKRFFNTEVARDEAGNVIDGYWKLIPKDLPGFVCIQTTYKDNPHLPAHIISNYEAYGNPESTTYNPFYYYTAILGYASSGRKGQVFTKFKTIKRADYLKLNLTEIYGQDFGTAKPAALIGAKLEKNRIYARLINYKPMPAIELGKMYCTLKFGLTDEIVADSADPKSWKKLKGGWRGDELPDDIFMKYPDLARGFFVVPAEKGDDSIVAGIDLLDGMEVYIVEEDVEFWDEVRNYCYAQDKYGNYTNKPIDDWNHCFTGDTLIETNTGQKTISSIMPGEMVLTTRGFKEVLIKWHNGQKQTNNYTIHFDTFYVNLSCTPDHKIKTDKGWIQISQLQSGQTVYLSNHSKDWFTGYTPANDTFQGGEKGCMSLFTNQSTEKDCQSTTSTIWMKIRGIIHPATWNRNSVKIIWQNIAKTGLRIIQSGLRNFTMQGLKQQKRGIVHPKELNGTVKMQSNAGLVKRLTGRLSAKFAALYSPKRKQGKDSAVMDANQNIDYCKEQTTNKEGALNAKLSLLSTNTRPQSHVQSHVVQSVHTEKGAKIKVYDLTVQGKHEFFANGVLVHNCIDCLRYIAQRKRGKGRAMQIEESPR